MNTISISEYSRQVGIPEEMIKGRTKIEKVAIARQVYWLYLNCNGLGCRKISQMVDRAAPTVYSGIKAIKNLVDTDNPLIHPYREFIDSFFVSK